MAATDSTGARNSRSSQERMDLARRDVAAILKQAQLDIDTAFLQAQLSNSTEATAPPPAIPPNAAAIQEAEEGQTRRDGHDGRDLSFEELVDSHKKLYQTLSQLQVEHRELQARYQSERDDWNKFRGWWHSVVAKKRASHGESTRMVGSEKTGIASSSSKGGSNVEAMSKKRKLSQGEQALFHRLGMECDATPMNATGQTPFSPRQSTSSGSEGEEKVFSRSESKRKEEEETIDQQRPCTASAIGGEASRNARSEDDDRALRKSARANSQDDIRDIANVKASEEEGRAEAQDLEFVQKEKHNTDRLRRMQELLANPLKYKGRGRYSNGTKEHTEGVEVDKERTPISKEYEIDPERNGGVDFLHKAVVRDKAQRKGMHAFDCECCREYYEAVGPPLRTNALGDPIDEAGEHRETRLQEHRQQMSRHRAYGPPELTPPGYWDIAFPTTQKQKELNQLAAEEHERKRRQMASDPRYKKRAQ